MLNFGNSCTLDFYCDAKSENTVYAKALDNCMLYKSQTLTDDFDNVYFLVPETYFVTILETISEKCYKVQYDKFIGYINSDTVIVATFTPIVKTLSKITLDIKETSGTQIWNKPSTSGNVLTTIPAATTDIMYVAKIYGDIPVGGENNLWYYISYTPLTNSTNVYEGYVYSENITNLSEIVVNAEANPEVVEEYIPSEIEKTITLSPTFKTIIIALISVPIILLISIILYKFMKKIKENTNKRVFQNNLQAEEYYENEYIDNEEQGLSIESNKHTSLKNKINKMRSMSYVKHNKLDSTKTIYPKFPSYNSDDDLL